MAHEKRSEFVLGTTLSELILLLFFLLLLLFAYHHIHAERQAAAQNEKIKQMVVEREKAESALRTIYTQLGRDPTDQEIKTLVSVDKLEALIAEKQKYAQKLEARIDGLNEILKRLREGSPLVNRTPEEAEKLSDIAFCEKQYAETSLKDKDLSEANRRNKELTARIAKCGGKGEEFVSCWRGEDGKIEFVFETRLNAQGVEVSRKWPTTRDAEMERFSAERSLVGRSVSVNEFKDLTTAMFKDSEQKACRYYVVISGKRSEMNAQMFTNYRRVQDHFYHSPAVN